jgi:hypothetical protein
MHDSVPEVPRADDSSPEPGPTPPPVHSGLTRFLVEDPSAAGISREALVEAVRALLRERDYLRRVRELALADFELEQKLQREHTEELLADRDALLADRDALRADRDALLADRDALLADRDALLADRDALRADRDAWQRKTTRSLPNRVMRTLRGLVKRPSRSS